MLFPSERRRNTAPDKSLPDDPALLSQLIADLLTDIVGIEERNKARREGPYDFRQHDSFENDAQALHFKKQSLEQAMAKLRSIEG